MPRVKRGFTLRRKRKRLFKLAKGFRGPRGNLYRLARESVDHALKFAYRDRRNKKRDFRRLWITRISAAAHHNNMNYSQFMLGLKRADIAIDRKVLSELAVNEPDSFAQLAHIARQHIG